MNDQHVYIKDMVKTMRVQGVYLAQGLEVAKTRAGKNYLKCTLADKTGKLEAKLWDINDKTLPVSTEELKSSEVVFVKFVVEDYMGKLQLNLAGLKPVGAVPDSTMRLLLPQAPIEPEEVFEELLETVRGFDNQDIRRLLISLMTKYKAGFLYTPAAERVHHSYRSGLLYHIQRMAQSAEALAGVYKILDRELLLAGVILHDIGKLREYELDDYGLVEKYSTLGNLVGHLSYGAMLVKDECVALGVDRELTMVIVHLILAHHGEKEYGSPVTPAIPEAAILHELDVMDMTVFLYEEALEGVEDGEFSDPVFFLNRSRLYKTAYVNQKDEAPGSEQLTMGDMEG